MQNTVFADLVQIAATFDAAKEAHKFPPTLLKINFSNYFQKSKDFTRASMTYFPLVIVMKSNTSDYESIFYLQYTLNRGAPPAVQVVKQKIVLNG